MCLSGCVLELRTCFFLRLASASAKCAARSSKSSSVGFSEEEEDNGRFLLNFVWALVDFPCVISSSN